MKTIQHYTISLALAGLCFSAPCHAAKTKYVKVSPRQDLAALLRNARARCSPMHHRMASTTFDLPHPFGPTTAVMPFSSFRSSFCAKELNPKAFSRDRYNRFSRSLPLVVHRQEGNTGSPSKLRPRAFAGNERKIRWVGGVVTTSTHPWG